MLRVTLLAMLLLGSSAIAADSSGKYEGTFASTEGDATGKLRIVIAKNADSTWLCKVFFSHDGEEVATKPVSCAIDENKIVTEFSVEADGAEFHATLKGTPVGDASFEGTYVTTGSAGGDHGTAGRSRR
jgi:hypothetical protein